MLSPPAAGNFARGGRALVEGARFLRGHRKLWPLLIVPIFLNMVLFVSFIAGSLVLIQKFFVGRLPPTWWGILIGVIVIVGSMAALFYIGTILFVLVGSVISAPFYDTLAQRVARAHGMIVVERSLWQEIWRPMKHAAVKLGWYGLIQLGLLVLSFTPGVGPVLYVGLGFLVTAFFLALEFLDFPFEFRGMGFTQRLRWCKQKGGAVLAFGGAVLIGMMIPVINLLVPPIAITAAIIFFCEEESIIV